MPQFARLKPLACTESRPIRRTVWSVSSGSERFGMSHSDVFQRIILPGFRCLVVSDRLAGAECGRPSYSRDEEYVLWVLRGGL